MRRGATKKLYINLCYYFTCLIKINSIKFLSYLEDDSTDEDEVAAAAAAATAADELSEACDKTVVVVCWPDKPDNARSTAPELTLDWTNDGADNGIGAEIGTGADNPDWALYLMKYTSGLFGWDNGTRGMFCWISSIDSGFLTRT